MLSLAVSRFMTMVETVSFRTTQGCAILVQNLRRTPLAHLSRGAGSFAAEGLNKIRAVGTPSALCYQLTAISCGETARFRRHPPVGLTQKTYRHRRKNATEKVQPTAAHNNYSLFIIHHSLFIGAVTDRPSFCLPLHLVGNGFIRSALLHLLMQLIQRHAVEVSSLPSPA